MKHLLFLFLMIFPTITYAGYYDVQHQSVIKDVDNVKNDWYYRGNIHLVTSTSTTSAALSTKYLQLYSTGSIKCLYINTGQGDTPCYLQNQNIRSTDSPTFSKINTMGENVECYPQDQNLMSTATVTFAQLNTGQGAGELFGMNQYVLSSSTPTFGGLKVDGYLGVKTASPSYPLHVTGASYLSDDVSLGAEWTLDNMGSSGLAIKSTANRVFRIYTSDTERLQVNGSGYVGIGTTNPFSPFHAHNNTSSPYNSWVTTNDVEVAMAYRNDVSTFVAGVRDFGTGDDKFFVFTVAGNVYAMTLSETGNMYIQGNCSAESFTDRTPYPKSKQEAYDAINSMRLKQDKSGVDHKKLHSFIKSKSGDRDMSAVISAQNEVIKDLIKRIEKLERR